MPTSSSIWNEDTASGRQPPREEEPRAERVHSDSRSAPSASRSRAAAGDESQPVRFRFGLSTLFAAVTVSAVLVFALVNAGENQVARAMAAVLIVVLVATPLVFLASRGRGRAVTYGVVFLLLGGLATGLIAGWVVQAIRSARTVHEKDDLRQIGGAMMFREETGREWQGAMPVQEGQEGQKAPDKAFLDALLGPGAGRTEADEPAADER